MSDLICHMLKRTDHLNTGDQLAIGQEYREWIKCIKNKDLVPQNILFINTSTFWEKYSIRRIPFFIFRKVPKLFQTPYLYTNHLMGMQSTIRQ